MKKVRPIKLWAIVKDGIIDPWSISPETDYIMDKGEKLIRVRVELNGIKKEKRKNAKLVQKRTR